MILNELQYCMEVKASDGRVYHVPMFVGTPLHYPREAVWEFGMATLAGVITPARRAEWNQDDVSIVHINHCSSK